MKKKGYSDHAKLRINERGNNMMSLNNKNLIKYSLKNGRKTTSIINFAENNKYYSPLIPYLKKITYSHKFSTIFIYMNYVLIFSKNQKTLITLYPLREDLLPYYKQLDEKMGTKSVKK